MSAALAILHTPPLLAGLKHNIASTSHTPWPRRAGMLESLWRNCS